MKTWVVIALVAGNLRMLAGEPSFAVEAASADARADALSRASRELRSTLESQRSDVRDWSIRALIDERAMRSWPDRAPATVSVSKIARRSSVKMTWDNESTLFVQTVWFDVAGMTDMLVAARDLKPGAVLTPFDGQVTQGDAMSVSCTTLHESAELQAMRTRRAFREGAAFCREALEPRPAVARGEDVIVRYVSPTISIQGKAVAQADAQIGQSVYVMNSTNRDPFRAVVSAMKEVVVHE